MGRYPESLPGSTLDYRTRPRLHGPFGGVGERAPEVGYGLRSQSYGPRYLERSVSYPVAPWFPSLSAVRIPSVACEMNRMKRRLSIGAA
jgi:hypothetical protein